MCFAPRYISGPIAAPVMPWRNRASNPDTPCAWPLVPIRSTSASDSAVTVHGLATPVRRSDLLGPAVLAVAGVTGFIDGFPRGKNVRGIFRFSRHEGLSSRVDHPA